MHYTGKRLNQLTDLGFRTITNTFELEVPSGKFIIEFLDVQCYSENEWNKLIEQVKEKTSKK